MSKNRTFRSRLASAGNGLLNAAVLAADLGPMTRMTEIEREIDRLQEEYAKLNEQLESSRRRPTPYSSK
jgi:hypothetical protein